MMNTALTKKAAANKGDSVKLFCKARGSPLPKFTWMFGSKTLSNVATQKYEIVYNNVSANAIFLNIHSASQYFSKIFEKKKRIYISKV